MAFGAGVFGGDPFGGLLPSGSTTNRRRRVLMGSGDTMIVARQSTARTITVGPVLDASGVAVTDGVVGDFKISKNGGAPGALNGSATLTHRAVGFYSLALTASDLDTVGQAEIVIDDSTNTCSQKELTVVEEAVYDAVFAASAAGYQVPIWAAAGSTVNLSATTIKTATDVETDTADIQTRLPAALVSGRIDASVGAMAANTITAAATASDYITEVQTAITGGAYALDTDANGRVRIVDGTGAGELDTTSGGVLVAALAANSITAAASAADFVTEVQSGLATAASIAALNNLSAAQVNAEVVDALSTDTYAEPGQSAPGATVSLAAKINWLYASWRNLKTNDGTTTKLYADDGTTIIAKQTTSESGGTVSKAEWITGA